MVVITVVIAWCLLAVPLALVVGRTIRDNGSPADGTVDVPARAQAAVSPAVIPAQADGPHPRLVS